MALPKNVTEVLEPNSRPRLCGIYCVEDKEHGVLLYMTMGLDGSVSLTSVSAPWLREIDPEE